MKKNRRGECGGRYQPRVPCSSICPRLPRDDCLRTVITELKTASVLLAGEDIRDRMPPMMLDACLRTYWHAPYAYMARVLRSVDVLRFPLTYPGACGEFFGYDRR